MKRQKRNLHVTRDKQQPRTPPNNPERPQGDLQSPEDKQERRERVLTQGASSMVSSIADSVVVKNENIFFLTEPDGDVPLNGAHALGCLDSSERLPGRFPDDQSGYQNGSLTDLFARAGEPDRAKHLRNEAQALRARFDQDFWQEDKRIYALALQAGGRPAAVVSSNPGHALWSGIAAGRTVERLMVADMFKGWGIRTLSEKEKRYNPVGHHLGSVWPHDNSIIAAGFRRYGFDTEALRIFSGH